MQITVTLDLSNEQVATFLSWIMKDDVLKSCLIGEACGNINKRLDELELSVRTNGCCRAVGFKYVRDIISKTERQMLLHYRFGRKSILELNTILEQLGLRFKDEDAPPEMRSEPKQQATPAGVPETQLTKE